MTTRADDAYLDGFVAGLEFLLLAMEGRELKGEGVDAFRKDYQRLVHLYRSKRAPTLPSSGMLAALLRN